MANEKQRKTFLSYSRVNTDFAKKLAKELKAEGFPVWLDQLDIPLGARWDVELEKALEESEIFMIIMTPDSIASENVRDEIGYAIDTGKRFLPIMLETCNVPLRLRRFQYVDFSTKSFEDGVESAKRLLRGLIEQDTIPRGKLSDDDKNRLAQAEAGSKSKKDAERIAKRSADEVSAAKVESDREAIEAVDVQSSSKVESNRIKASRETVIKASDLLAQGRKFIENKDWEKAAEKFRQVLTFTPNHAETIKLLADAEAQIAQADKEVESKAKEETDRLAAQKAEADKLAKQKAEEERVAKAEADRKAKEEADRLAAQKAEADKLAKQKAEEERVARAKADTDRKAREEADRLAAQKAEMERVAKQQAEADRVKKEKAALVVQPNEKPAGKRSMTKGVVIGGVIGMVVCVVAVLAISSWGNNTVEPTDTPLKATATKLKSTATNKPNPTATKQKTATAVPVITEPVILNSTEATKLYEAGEYTGLYSIAFDQHTEEQINDFHNNNEWIPVELTISTPIAIGYGWCAANSDILQDNLGNIYFYFVVDDKDVPEDKYVYEYFTIEDGWECYRINVIIDQWVAGEYPIYYGLVFDQNLNDGESDYYEGDGGQIAIYVTVP